MNIEPWDVHAATEDDLREQYEWSLPLHAEADPETPPYPFELWRRELLTQSQFHEVRRWLARDGDALVGYGELGLDRSGNNAHLANFHIEVAPAHRRGGVARATLARIVEAAAGDGRTTLMSSTPQGSVGEGFLGAVGMENVYLDRRSRLRVGEVDEALVDAWLADAKAKAADYSLVYFDGRIPDEHLDAVMAVHEVMNDRRAKGLALEDEHDTAEHFREREGRLLERGTRRLQIVARHDPSGEFAGFTTIAFHPLLPQVAWQWGTAVGRDHRGHTIGRWIKAANFRWLRELNPDAEFVDTWNVGSNQWMLAINDELGFRPYIWYTAWQGTTESITQAIA